MSSQHLFEANLDVIERAITRVCRQARLDPAGAEDFASVARLALLADDCAILRKFEERSSLGTYVTIVVRRLLIDARRAEGRWYSSAEAERHGPAAVALECLLHRDRRSLIDAVAIVRSDYPDVTARELEKIAEGFPARAPRMVLVPVAGGAEERFAGSAVADDLVDALDIARRSKQTSEVVRGAMGKMTAQDRAILGLRFSGNASVAAIAKALGLEQRPLYRRVEALLGSLRGALAVAGIDAASVNDLIGAADEPLDFGLDGKRSGLHPSIHRGEAQVKQLEGDP